MVATRAFLYCGGDVLWCWGIIQHIVILPIYLLHFTANCEKMNSACFQPRIITANYASAPVTTGRRWPILANTNSFRSAALMIGQVTTHTHTHTHIHTYTHTQTMPMGGVVGRTIFLLGEYCYAHAQGMIR